MDESAQILEEKVPLLRRELFQALMEDVARNAELKDLRSEKIPDLGVSGSVYERVYLRFSTWSFQKYLEQSMEMLTRAGIDELGDKSRIGKEDKVLCKSRTERNTDEQDCTSHYVKITGLTEAMNRLSDILKPFAHPRGR